MELKSNPILVLNEPAIPGILELHHRPGALSPNERAALITSRTKEISGTALHRNCSHRGPFLVIAWSPFRVGFDVEVVESTGDELSVAREFFSPEEYSWLSGSSASDLPVNFRQLWAAREAILKMEGRGIVSFPAITPVVNPSDFDRWPPVLRVLYASPANPRENIMVFLRKVEIRSEVLVVAFAWNSPTEDLTRSRK